MRHWARVLGCCTAGLLLLPSLVWGVSGTVVTPRGTQPPKKISLVRRGSPPVEAPVDAAGRFEATLPPGRYRVSAEDYVPTKVEVAPNAGSLTVPLQPIDPPMVQNPPHLGGLGLALGWDGIWYGNLDKTFERVTTTDRDAAGNVVGSSTTFIDPDQTNRDFEKPFDMHGIFADVPVGLGQWQFDSTSVQPAIVGSIGYYDWAFAPRNRVTGMEQEFSGDGVVLGIGGEVLVRRGPWFGAASALYRTNVSDTVSRSPAVTPPAGGTVREDGDLDFHQLRLWLRGGRTFHTGWPYVRSVAPFVGVEYDWMGVTLDTTVVGTLPDGSTRTLAFRDELERDAWRGLVGADVHIAGPFFARVLGTFDDCDQSVALKAAYAFWAD